MVKNITLSFYVKDKCLAATHVVELYRMLIMLDKISQAFSVTDSWNRVTLVFHGDTNRGF